MVPTTLGLIVILVGLAMIYMGLHGWAQTQLNSTG